MGEARRIFRSLGMADSSQVMEIECLVSNTGDVLAASPGQWFRGPGEIASDGPVQLVPFRVALDE